MMTAIHLGLLVPLLAAGPQSDPSPYIHIDRLTPRVAVAYWPGIDRRCNLTAIQSRKGLVIIDTEAAPRLMAPIKKKFEQTFHRTDWAYVINTHAHDNHAGGNSLFPGAVIIGHENLAADMQGRIRRLTEPDSKRRQIDHYQALLRELRAALPQYATNRLVTRLIQSDLIFYDLFLQDLQQGYEIVKPSLTFSDKYTLDLGDVTLELIFFGKGHSTSDILIYVPQERVLVTGAIAYQQYRVPEIGEESHLEDVHRFIAVLDRLLADDVKIEHVIPGHSVLLTRTVLPPIRDYYQRMLTEVAAARRQGLTLDQATKLLTLRAKFPAFRDPPPGTYGDGHQERSVRNLWRILAEGQPAPQPEPAQP